MKGPLKFFIDIVPFIVFFIFYKKTINIIDAIIPLIIATTIAILVSYIIEKKIPVMPTFAGILILFFGGLTLYFKDPIFIKMKEILLSTILQKDENRRRWALVEKLKRKVICPLF